MLNNIEFVPLVIGYVFLNIILIYFFYKWLNKRIGNQFLAWLFSISLCLGSTFLIALLVLYAMLRF